MTSGSGDYLKSAIIFRVVSLFLEEENDCESKKLIFEVFHFRNRFSREAFNVGIGWNCGDIVGRYRGYDSFLNNFETFPNFNPFSFVEIFGIQTF